MSYAAAPPPPPDYNGMLEMDDIGSFRYGIGVSIGVLLLITTITLASYYCTRSQLSHPQPSRTNHNVTHVDDGLVHVIHIPGLDEDTIRGYPKILYSEAKVMKRGSDDSTTSCCSICLGDYKTSDLLRQLPDCNHMFHVKCVDTWLRLNPTCPVCRTSPLPTPVATPLAEVVPLASAAASVGSTRMS
ncbi:PREDICTED: RING-H2 finger protein ATL70 [Tarenaya hassleriana]|uniref:RING-H2 finger protein ATL70 n=1 Tax=Tarenaya hassleriana TaxID=28532 RepID=UPI00053C3B61|nr:PREDICTED: RING-H2 finger protein ATL70 [Tarenaya hassleriana]